MKAKINLIFLFFILFSGMNIYGQDKTTDSLLNIVKTAKADTSRIYALQDLFLIFEFEDQVKAKEYIEKAIEIGLKNNDHQTLANSYIFRGYLSEDVGDYKLAGKYYRMAISEAKKCKFNHAEGRALNSIGELNRLQGNYDTALVYYNKSIEIMKKINYPGNVAASMNNISLVYKEQGKYWQAIRIQEEAMEINKKRNKIQEILRNLTNIGIVYYDMGDYQKALNYYLKAADLVKEKGNKTDIGPVYNNIGLIMEKLGNSDKAMEYYKKTYKIYEDLGSKREMAAILDNIGNVYITKKDYRKANEIFLKSLQFGNEIEDKNSISRSLINLGNTFYFQRKFDEAIPYLLKSYEIRKEIGEKNGEADALINLGSVYYEKGNLVLALKYDLLGLEISRQINSREGMKLAYDNLHSVYAKQNDFQKAYKSHVLFSSIKDSLLNESGLKQISQLEARYESERKENEIKMLNKDNQVKELIISNKEKEVYKQRIVIFFALVGFIIITVFSVFLLRLYKQKKIANSLLVIKNEEILQKNEEITSQRDEIESQRDLLSEQNEKLFEQKQEITDSINYAKRIQQAVLLSDEYAKNILVDYFILFKPKDIVSGDFYWSTKINNWLIVAVADCTGHGVPGAFMSMLGISFLNEIVRKKEVTRASEVLDQLRISIIDALQQKGTSGEQKDGMDIGFCAINSETLEMQFAGANNPCWIVSHLSSVVSPLIELKPDKQPIGIHTNMSPFTNQKYQLQKGDIIYFMSDGYEDQFGGPNRKKFLAKNLKNLLIANSLLPMAEQKRVLETNINEWIGGGEQIDDITILGVKF